MTNLILILLSAIVPLVLLLGSVFAWRHLFDRDRRRSPLNFKVLNLPGDSLRTRMAEHDASMDEAGVMAIVTGPLILAAGQLQDSVVRAASRGLQETGSSSQSHC